MEEIQGVGFVVNMVCLTWEISQTRRGAQDAPSLSSSSERDISSKVRPPRHWKGKQLSKSLPSNDFVQDEGAEDREAESSSSTISSKHTRQSLFEAAQSNVDSPQHLAREEVLRIFSSSPLLEYC